MSGAHGHGQVGDEAVDGLAAAVRDHRPPAGLPGHLDGGDRLGHGPDLVELDQHGVGRVLPDALGDPLDVGHEEVVADELDGPAEGRVQQLPAVPIVLGQSVLDDADGVLAGPFGVHPDHLIGLDLAVLGPQVVQAVLVDAAHRAVDRQHDVLAGPVAGLLDGLEDRLDRVGVLLEGRGEAALVADAGRIPARLEDALERMIGLGAPAQGLAEARRPDRGDHELLQVGALPVGVDAAVEDIEHRHGQHVGAGAPEGPVERHFLRRGGGPGRGHADAEDGVGPELGLVFGAVELDHGPVDGGLVEGVETGDAPGDRAVDVGHGLEHALAEITGRVAVAQLEGLVGAGRGAGRDAGPAPGAVGQRDLDLDGRIAAGIEDLAGMDVLDIRGHGMPPDRFAEPF
jgi:hypothetical protein